MSGDGFGFRLCDAVKYGIIEVGGIGEKVEVEVVVVVAHGKLGCELDICATRLVWLSTKDLDFGIVHIKILVYI